MTKLYGLKVCSVVNPFGLDSAPRFGWKMSSDVVGEKQTAYEITVFENMGTDKKEVWSSGKVNSSKHSGIVCGAELKPATSYEWSVVAYGKDGEATQPAVSGFVTGLMDSGWSGAQWITAESGDEDLINVKNYTVEVSFRFDREILMLLATGSHRRYYRFDIGCSNDEFYLIPQYFNCDSQREYTGCKTGRADLGKLFGITPEEAVNIQHKAEFKVTSEKIDVYSIAAGIKPIKAFDEFEISPEPNKIIDSIAAEYESESGRIVSAWRYEGDMLIFNIEIPANTSANVKLPCDAGKIVSVDGEEGIVSKKNGDGYTELCAVSGKYTIVTKA